MQAPSWKSQSEMGAVIDKHPGYGQPSEHDVSIEPGGDLASLAQPRRESCHGLMAQLASKQGDKVRPAASNSHQTPAPATTPA